MNIVVCIKQVPETNDVRINNDTNTLIREGVPSIINPFDTYALEEALRLKEKLGGKVTVFTMGPPQAEEALRQAISLGIDEAILISDRRVAGSDTLATSYTLAEALKKYGEVDLIICGKQAMDGDTAQVGPGIAESLGLPHITYVKKIEEIRPDDRYLKVERMMEEGYEVIETNLPALITVVKEINEPRVPSLKGMMRAKKAEIVKWSAADLALDEKKIGLDGSPTWVIKIFTPEARSGGQMLQGSPREQVEQLAGKLKEIKLV